MACITARPASGPVLSARQRLGSRDLDSSSATFAGVSQHLGETWESVDLTAMRAFGFHAVQCEQSTEDIDLDGTDDSPTLVTAKLYIVAVHFRDDAPAAIDTCGLVGNDWDVRELSIHVSSYPGRPYWGRSFMTRPARTRQVSRRDTTPTSKIVSSSGCGPSQKGSRNQARELKHASNTELACVTWPARRPSLERK